MSQSIRKLFENFKDIEPSRELKGKIFKAISHEKSREVARKLAYARAGIAVSFAVLASALFVFGRTFLQSDFWNLAKLAFSDTGTIAANSGDFSISLLETMPVLEIFAMLMPVCAVLAMLSYYFKFTNHNYKVQS